MAHNGLNWQTLQLPLAAGLSQKHDDRARPQPYLDICRDVQFDEIGGLQTRLPFGLPDGAIFGGGTIANARRIVEYGNESVLFTSDSVYSRNAQLAKWVLRGTHLAVAQTERPAFETTGDQTDGDVAELAGTVVHAWTEGPFVYMSAHDKATGAVLVTPTVLVTGLPVGRCRVVALATKILVFTDAGFSNLVVRAIDPASPAAGIASAGTSVAAGVFNAMYDVVKVEGQDLCIGAYRRTTTTSYTVFTVTPALTVTSVTKARTADGPLAVATTPGTGLQAQVIRGNGTNVQGDFLTTSTLADLTINQAVGTVAGTPINQIAACFRSIANAGAFRCYVFWDSQESAGFGSLFVSKSNFVDTAGAIGTQANFVPGLGIGSRAFTFNGSVFVWMTFGQTSVFQGDVALANITNAQNAYLLYRDDAFIAAKCAYGVGGGLRPTAGLLPGVALTAGSSTFTWVATAKRLSLLGTGGTGGSGYAARSMHDVVFTFDSNEARRTALLGNTLYIAGGEILQYDGTRLTELGFHFYPWSFDMLKAGAGSVPNGVLTYKIAWRWANAAGESERSTTATIGLATMAGGPAGFVMGTLAPLTATHKTMVAGAIAAEVFRSAVNQGGDSPLFLATSNDPQNNTNPNKYIANDPTATFLPAVAWRDELADAALTTREPHPENGAVLENLCPPAATIIIATDTRLFLAGVVGDPDRIWYSKERGVGQLAAFHDTLTADVPRDGGAITSIVVYDGTLFAFRETAVYALPGIGKDNLGQGSNFGPARIVSLDVGAVNHESVAITPVGVLFKSRKGWQVLLGNGTVRYVGDKISDSDAEAVLAVNVAETQHHVRILTASRMLVWDYLVDQWGQWTITDGVHAAMINGAHVYLTATGTRTQLTTYTGLTYGDDVETAWIKLADLQGAAVVHKVQPLGEHRSAGYLLRVRIAYDYEQVAGVPVYVDDKVWSPSPAVIGGPLQFSHGPKRPRCQAIKVRFTAVSAGTSANLDCNAMSPPVDTSGVIWGAQWAAIAPGELGNVLTMSVSIEDGPPPFSIDVRDHFAWSQSLQMWLVALNNIGVRVVCRAGSRPTVAQLEAAIVAGSALVDLDQPDVAPSKLVTAVVSGSTSVGSFGAGAFGAPTGESLKLTGLGLEVGIEPGLFRRLPAAQQQ